MAGNDSRLRPLGRGVAAAVTLALASTLVGASAIVAQGEEATLERIQREGIARVGFSNEAPFAFAGPEGVTGAAPEIMRAVFAEAGVTQLEGILVEFSGLIPGLVANRFDVIGAGMFVRPARCEEVDFGDPEYALGEGLAVVAGNPKGLTTLQGFVDSGARLGLLTGGAEVEYADIAGIAKEQQVLYPDGPTAIAGLQAGQVDAVMLTTLSINDLVTKSGDPNIEFATMTEQPVDADGNPAIGYGAMAFRKDDDELRNFYNERLAALKASGELLTIMEPFGFTEAEMTDVKATEICPDIS
ncbi:ectoine/hydroxyectoine ABC transporter substrate-binding protein EhuB [soil metagenome]